MLAVIWWMYDGYAWLTNAIATDHLRHRLLLIGGMGAFLVIALAVPGAYEGKGLAFGIGYLAVVALHAGMYVRGTSLSEVRAILRHRPLQRRSCCARPRRRSARRGRPVGALGIRRRVALVHALVHVDRGLRDRRGALRGAARAGHHRRARRVDRRHRRRRHARARPRPCGRRAPRARAQRVLLVAVLLGRRRGRAGDGRRAGRAPPTARADGVRLLALRASCWRSSPWPRGSRRRSATRTIRSRRGSRWSSPPGRRSSSAARSVSGGRWGSAGAAFGLSQLWRRSRRSRSAPSSAATAQVGALAAIVAIALVAEGSIGAGGLARKLQRPTEHAVRFRPGRLR